MEERAPDRPWSLDAAEVAAALAVEPQAGLSSPEAAARLERWGPNTLAEGRSQSVWKILLRQGRSLVALLLGAAGVAAFAFGEWAEGIAIGVVILVNAAIGFATELRAIRSVESLRRLGEASARVRRDGGVREVPAAEVVPGDVLSVEAGDLMSADARVLTASRLETDESQLTGESLPVSKGASPVAEDAVLAERSSLLFKGTAVVKGSAVAVAVATGMSSELGRIASLVETAEAERTPLERKLDALGRRLAWAALAVATLIAGAGILGGRNFFLMIETGVALAVAAIPEGLVIVATLALARGVWRMAERKALVNRLSAVETLGAVTVICTDKTGTLTENRMTLTRLAVADGEAPPEADDPVVRRALEAAVLCNNAVLDGDGAIGDPLEVALLRAGEQAGLARPALLARYPEVEREAFDSAAKRMATVHREGEGFLVAVKGAPEAVLSACSRVAGAEDDEPLDDEARDMWLGRNHALGTEGYRLLGLAARRASAQPENPYQELTWLGLAILSDPPRKEAREAVERCRRAGIETIMITGDQAATARAIALAVGLTDDEEAEVLTGRDLTADASEDEERRRRLAARLFARVDPEQKLGLVALHQQAGAVVAMTGDGVNDAPALKKADIGITMGQRGSQVAREAADVVLKEDSFATIVAAIRQGRVIFENIRRFVLYLVSCNASEILVVGSAALVAAPLPVLPLQLLFLNVVTDVFPALALGLGEGDAAVMDRPPRPPAEPILGRRHWWAVGGYGIAISIAVLGALAVALRVFSMSEPRAVTVTFLTLAFAQLWHVFNMAQRTSGLVRNEVTRNPWVWGALGLCTVLLVLAVYVPPLAVALKLVDPGAQGWLLVAVASLVPLGLGVAGRAILGEGERG